MTTNHRSPSKLAIEAHQLAYREVIRQTRQMHNFNLIAMTTPIFVTLAGCYFIFNGQPAGASITAVGTVATTVCIPLAKVSSQESNRKLGRLMKEAKEMN